MTSLGLKDEKDTININNATIDEFIGEGRTQMNAPSFRRVADGVASPCRRHLVPELQLRVPELQPESCKSIVSSCIFVDHVDESLADKHFMITNEPGGEEIAFERR